MTEYIPEGVEAQVGRTRRAQKTFEKIAVNFEAIVERLNPDTKPSEALAKDIQGAYREYLRALIKANEEEAKLATESEKFNGVIRGGALDLAEARTEILERIARLRERGSG